MSKQLTLREVVRMLCDRTGWYLTRSQKGEFLDDEATYRDTGIYTYLDCDGVRFREYGTLGEENYVVYMPNFFTGVFIISPLTNRVRRYLKRRVA